MFPHILLANAAKAFAESFIDNVFRDSVTSPAPGSVLYCDLFLGQAEHSGIYVGNNQIVHLDGTGRIELVSPAVFLKRLDGNSTGSSIYVSCKAGRSVGSKEVAKRALSSVGQDRDYSLLFDNCHQFTAGCLSGEPENAHNFLWMLKMEAQRVLGADEWRVWEKDSNNQHVDRPKVSDAEALERLSNAVRLLSPVKTQLELVVQLTNNEDFSRQLAEITRVIDEAQDAIAKIEKKRQPGAMAPSVRPLPGVSLPGLIQGAGSQEKS